MSKHLNTTQRAHNPSSSNQITKLKWVIFSYKVDKFAEAPSKSKLNIEGSRLLGEIANLAAVQSRQSRRRGKGRVLPINLTINLRFNAHCLTTQKARKREYHADKGFEFIA